MENKIINIIDETKTIYREISQYGLEINIIEKASLSYITKFEKQLGLELPIEYKYYLKNNDFAIDFDHGYKCLALNEVVDAWQCMNEILDDGGFDDGRVERHIKEDMGNWDGDYIKQVWWSPYWIPFAEDSCGNKKCIDLEPGRNGTQYQLIAMEIQDGLGPFVEENITSFLDYIEKNLGYLKNKQYTIDENGYGDGKPLIEIDSFIDPDNS